MDDDIRAIPWHIGCDILKAEEGHVHGERVRYVEGIASEESRDQQGEILIHSGINFAPLLGTGHINYDHLDVRGSGSPDALIGIPTEAKIVKGDTGLPAFFVAGRLFTDPHLKPMADACWRHMLALQQEMKSTGRGPTRRMGWSVQGRSLMKVNGRIERSVVSDMAITHKPVHLGTSVTFSEVMKSLDAAAHLTPERFLALPDIPVADLLRAADYASDAPLMREDLRDAKGGKVKGGGTAANGGGAKVMRAVYGDPGSCKCGNVDHATGRFKGGKAGAVEHWTKCCGMDGGEAEGLATILHGAMRD